MKDVEQSKADKIKKYLESVGIDVRKVRYCKRLKPKTQKQIKQLKQH